MRDGGREAVVTRWKALDMATMWTILKELSRGAENSELVKKYSVLKSTISMTLKENGKDDCSNANSIDRKCLQKATYVDIEDMVVFWRTGLQHFAK